MKQYQLKNTDLGPITAVGLGTTATKRWGDQANRVFDTFIDLGGNVVDTARVYSVFADSEPIIGKWLTESGKRDKIILISKGGHPELKSFPPDMHAFRLSKKEMVQDLEESLQMMKTDYLDIYLYHRDDMTRSVEELVETMQDFVRQGKIRYYGVSNWTLPRIKEAQAYAQKMGYRGFVMNQSLFNAASDHMLPPWDDTLVIIDEEMQAYHNSIQGTDYDILCTGFSGNCGGFFSQYAIGGEEAVKDKSYLTPENIQLAKELSKRAEEKGTSLLKEVFAFYTSRSFPSLGLFAPRDAESLVALLDKE